MHVTLENAKTLVLNADMRPLSYNPLSVWTWQDAVNSVFKGKAYVIENYDEVKIRSPSIEIPVPSVIALNNYVYANHHVRFTRYNIYLRDKFTCAYCGNKHEAKDLSFDHLHPRSKGGKTTWENILTSCIRCNQIKNDKSLEDVVYPKGHDKAGQRMKLFYNPYIPTAEQFRRADRLNYSQLHDSWENYIYWESELEN